MLDPITKVLSIYNKKQNNETAIESKNNDSIQNEFFYTLLDSFIDMKMSYQDIIEVVKREFKETDVEIAKTYLNEREM